MISNPHDALFKSVFGQPEHARGALRAIVPAALAEALDWSTLALQPGSFVKDAIMTAGQPLIEQGRQQGIEQGIEQGRQRLQEMLLRQLRQRFGDDVNAQVVQRVATASFEQIEVWSTRVLSASTLADLFAD